jgi:hypothetical protein
VSYYEEEAFYHFTMMDFIELVEHYGDRVWAELEKHSPAVYESFCAYKANNEIEEFLDKQYKEKMKDKCDYWKDEAND